VPRDNLRTGQVERRRLLGGARIVELSNGLGTISRSVGLLSAQDSAASRLHQHVVRSSYENFRVASGAATSATAFTHTLM